MTRDDPDPRHPCTRSLKGNPEIPSAPDAHAHRRAKLPAMKVPYDDLHATLRDVLRARRMERERADQCARLFADSSRDGVASHGVNRFTRFVVMVRSGMVDVHARPVRVSTRGGTGAVGRRRGPGNLNAWSCMARAIELAREHGIGAVGPRQLQPLDARRQLRVAGRRRRL
jgi:LDH2 family malate/lactate/ureidoglycolate dehydrogenase